MTCRLYSDWRRRTDYYRNLTVFALDFWTDVICERRHFGLSLTVLGFELVLNTMRRRDY